MGGTELRASMGSKMGWRPAILALGLLAGTAGYSTPALADASSARHNFFTNLSRAGISLNVNETSSRALPTLIRGMYVLTSMNGQFLGFINEPGTLFGDFRGLNVFSPSGGPQRPLSPDEAAELRAEIMASLDYDKLIRVAYGDGGGRRMLMFSALDCPYCKKFEDAFRNTKAPVGTTFYVLPSSLQPIDRGGMQIWEGVSRIWCAQDNSSAWQDYWTSKKLPAQRACEFDPQTASTHRKYVKEIFQGAGLKISGTPTIVREDGNVVPLQANSSPEARAEYFGREGYPQASYRPPRWLVAHADGAAGVAASSTAQQPGTQPAGKVNVKDVLNKLFK